MERDDEVDVRRIRAGLIVVSAAFLVALAVAVIVDDATARIVMGLVMFSALIRAALLVRGLRR